jgi:hypothetical protein
MVEWLTVALALVVVVLAAILTTIAWSAARRFEERRFAYITVAFLVMSLTGVMSIIDETFDLFDEQFAMEPGPLLLIVVALAFLYLGLLRGDRMRESPPHG